LILLLIRFKDNCFIEFFPFFFSGSIEMASVIGNILGLWLTSGGMVHLVSYRRLPTFVVPQPTITGGRAILW
jgi:hypothetical protein